VTAQRDQDRERYRANARRWQAKNREKAHAAEKRWREAHKDERREYFARRYQDPEVRARQNELARLRRLADPEKARAQEAKQRESNREKLRIQARESYEPHPGPGLISRIDARIERLDTGHWHWRGSRIGNQAMVQHQKRQLSVRRVLYKHFVGPVDDNMEIAATCGDRDCFRPSHCTAMTRAERRKLDAINPFVKTEQSALTV